MDYFDDLLNVFGYLRSKSRQTADNLNTALRLEAHRERLLEDLPISLDSMESILRQAADEYGIPWESDTQIAADPASEPEIFKKIRLPGDMDYSREFSLLAAEAKASGFSNVHPEELLTAEEMKFAMDYDRKLDRQFADAVGLTAGDLSVAAVGVGLHLLRIFLPKAVYSFPPASEEIYDFQNKDPFPSRKRTIGSLLSTVRDLNSIIPAKNYVGVKTVSQIFSDKPAFENFTDQRYPDRTSVLGFDPLLGWIFGVYNILTETVTLSDLHTFLPEQDLVTDSLTLAREYLPLRDALSPFAVGGLADKRDPIIAAVIREAFVLIPKEISFSTMAEHYDYCQKLSNITAQGLQVLEPVKPLEGIHYFLSQAGFASIINTVLIALHGLKREKHADLKLYMVRTMKVITLANFISSVIGSLHILVDQNYLGADWGGLASSLIEALHTTRLWIDVKSSFLTSAYLPQLQKQLNELDRYFEI